MTLHRLHFKITFRVWQASLRQTTDLPVILIRIFVNDGVASINEMAKDLDFDETDEDIVEMISVVWKKIYAN